MLFGQVIASQGFLPRVNSQKQVTIYIILFKLIPSGNQINYFLNLYKLQIIDQLFYLLELKSFEDSVT